MIRRPPRATRTEPLFPYTSSSDLEIGVAIYRDERGGFQTSFADTRSPRKHVVANGRTTLIEGSASGPSVLLSGPGSGIGTFPQFIQDRKSTRLNSSH